MSNYGEPAAPAPVFNHTELAELRAENERLTAELAVVKQALRDTGAVARGAEQDAFEAWLNVGGS